MSCCPAPAWANQFNRGRAARELRDYQRHGPAATTRALIDALVRMGVNQGTLLDIGGGVGAIQLALLAAGARGATSVDAASNYEEIARGEAERHGVRGRITYQLGDFVDLAPEVAAADIVTLDRVVCCYAHMEPLLRLSAQRCRRLYGLVYPRDRWLAHVVIGVENFFRRLWRNPFRSFIHSIAAMDELIRSLGFTLRHKVRTLAWEVVVYERHG
ncbi:MAG TPA: methyltransferase domain-containing protein [Gemmatimonadales bacterium]|nr:methyltransferase domain-containing protein [Gemmatimonadales bacterium]